jgi:hypothetical protein
VSLGDLRSDDACLGPGARKHRNPAV